MMGITITMLVMEPKPHHGLVVVVVVVIITVVMGNRVAQDTEVLPVELLHGNVNMKLLPRLQAVKATVTEDIQAGDMATPMLAILGKAWELPLVLVAVQVV